MRGPLSGWDVVKHWYVLVRIIKNFIPSWSYNLLNFIRRYTYYICYTIIMLCIHFVSYQFHPRGVVHSIDMQISDRRRHHLYELKKLEEGTFILLVWEFFLKNPFSRAHFFSLLFIYFARAPKGFPDIDTIITKPLEVVLWLPLEYMLSFSFLMDLVCFLELKVIYILSTVDAVKQMSFPEDTH